MRATKTLHVNNSTEQRDLFGSFLHPGLGIQYVANWSCSQCEGLGEDYV